MMLLCTEMDLSKFCKSYTEYFRILAVRRTQRLKCQALLCRSTETVIILNRKDNIFEKRQDIS